MRIRGTALPVVRLLLPRAGRGLRASAGAVIAALWIGICAAAPEIIWQGLRLALSHINGQDLLSALLIGLVLAFFVEPVMEFIRSQLARARHHPHPEHRSHDALFTASLGLAFALTSISMHEAMTTFLSAGRGAHASPDTGLLAGVDLTVAWAITPFAVTIAWLTIRSRWLAVPTGIFAAASSWFVAWLFVWPVQTVISSTVPCLFILALGYRHMRHSPGPHVLARCARSVAIVGTIWLVVALVFDTAVGLLHREGLTLYDEFSFWMDVRYYLGWAVGLALAPSPYRRPAVTSPAPAPPPSRP